MRDILLRKFITFSLFVGFSLISITLLTANRNLNVTMQNFNDRNSENFNILRYSPSTDLNQSDHVEIHGYADQAVEWSFSTLPSQIINVWAFDAKEYSRFDNGWWASGYLL